MKLKATIRQGDVLLVPATKIPTSAKEILPRDGVIVLAYGEVTGHQHAIYDVGHKARLWDAGAERFLQVLETVALQHEEHTEHIIKPGIYRLPTQVEYTPKEVRRVAD